MVILDKQAVDLRLQTAGFLATYIHTAGGLWHTQTNTTKRITLLRIKCIAHYAVGLAQARPNV